MASQRLDRFVDSSGLALDSLSLDGNVGHAIVQLRLLFRAVPLSKTQMHPIFETFLTYVQLFDVASRTTSSTSSSRYSPDPFSKMFMVKRSLRSTGERMGDIIPLNGLRAAADLTPCFRTAADARLTKYTSLEYSDTFLLNDLFSKYLFFALNDG